MESYLHARMTTLLMYSYKVGLNLHENNPEKPNLGRKFWSMKTTNKGKVNKIISGLTSVGLLILLIFPASLSASHFRYGTMSWEPTGNDNATHREIRLKLESGWDNGGGMRVILTK